MPLAPIAFFAYKRPSHTLASLKSLSQCELAQDSKLFIFCDGAKNCDEEVKVQEVRRIAEREKWCGQVEIRHQESNRGLAVSLISGITELCERYGRVIVIEDDLVLSQGFLSYMNLALDKYAGADRVLQVSGHVFPVLRKDRHQEAFFMPVSTSQGWGIWKRSWDSFDENASGHEQLGYDDNLRSSFDLDGACNYSSLLKAQLDGKIDSWAIRWWWSFFKQKGLCLYPSASLLVNIGFGLDDATHTKDMTNYYNDPFWSSNRLCTSFPQDIVPNHKIFSKVKRYLALRSPGTNIIRRIIKYVKIVTHVNCRS